MREDNNLYQKCYVFALRIIKVNQHLNSEKREFILSKQLLRSGTAIGANVAEANGGISVADFLAKISIAYKESLETKYWLNLLKDADYLDITAANSVINDTDELSKILFSVLKKIRINNNN